MAAQPALDLREDDSIVEAHPGPSNRRAIVVGLALLVLILAVLAAGVIVERRYRAPVGIQATGGAGAVASPAVTAQVGGPAVITQPADIARLSSPLEREVALAYFRYWDVYAAAMESLDTSRLPEVTANGRLQEAMAEVGDLRADGIAARIQVQHSFSVVSATSQEATVRDDYADSSYALNPDTKQPVGIAGPSNRVVNLYYLRMVDGAWKVVGGRREGP